MAYKFATSANMTPKIFVTNFLQIFFNMGIKNAEFDINVNEISIKFCVFFRVVDPDPDPDPYSIGSVDPDPYSQYGSESGSRRAKMTQKSRQ